MLSIAGDIKSIGKDMDMDIDIGDEADERTN